MLVTQDPFADLGCNRAHRQRLDENSGSQDSSLGMAPAQKGFRSDHRVVCQADLGLEIQFELVLGEGSPQRDIQSAARLRLRPTQWVGLAGIGLGLAAVSLP